MRQLPGAGAAPILVWRNRFFMTFLAAVVVMDLAVMVVGVRMSFFYHSLHVRGEAAEARVTRHERRTAIRAVDNDFYFYTYRTAAGTSHEGNTARHSFEVGDTFAVTYLPDAPEEHALFSMPSSRVRQPIHAAGTFAAASLAVTLLFGAITQWALNRRER